MSIAEYPSKFGNNQSLIENQKEIGIGRIIQFLYQAKGSIKL